MNKKMSKRQRDLKTKLMAAICMLLVSSIMMVSTTYAWFTLSTAPEVTGISTAVGANGNLEMALLPKSGDANAILSQAGDSVLDTEARNVTWGNLVDLSDSDIYGLDEITLYPSALNAAVVDDKGNPTSVADTLLMTPEYGSDGRVSELKANTVTGYFDKGAQKFSPNDDKGVRAVGTASGMTDRQLDYRNARSAANTAKAQSQNLAAQSLNNNGSSLANIAIEYGMGADTASFDKTDVAALRTIINDLKGTNGILAQIEKAYIQSILAYAASAVSGDADTVWQAVKGAVTAENATLDTVLTSIGGVDNLPEAVAGGIALYRSSLEDVNEADSALQTLESELATDEAATFTWDEIRTAMTPLANPAEMSINGFKASEVKENLGDLVSSVTEQGGLKVIMGSGAGVYADVADQSGDYTASVTIERVEYNGIILNNMKARMETDSDRAPNYYLDAIASAVSAAGAPQGTGDTVLPISDMYGYIIDLAFRTNAAESSLLLSEATDRIYDGNSNEETMGHGSTMTFKATTTDFSDEQVKSLMSAIRIVFFDPGSKNVVATAKLDIANATTGAEGITAAMYTYKLNGGATATTYNAATYAANSGLTYYTKSVENVYTQVDDATAAAATGKLYVASGASYVEEAYTAGSGKTYFTMSTKDKYTAVDDTTASTAPAGTLYTAVTTTGEERVADNKVMDLTQNTATALSCLVYLDGNNVGNDDVAATASTSMTGKMNLQFKSSANLVPMDYAALNLAEDANTNGNG